VDQLEVLAVVLPMAANAVVPIGILHLKMKMVAMLIGESFGDFLVAVEALKCGRSCTKNMARVASGCSVKRGMPSRERTR